jgi:hypothetical protein
MQFLRDKFGERKQTLLGHVHYLSVLSVYLVCASPPHIITALLENKANRSTLSSFIRTGMKMEASAKLFSTTRNSGEDEKPLGIVGMEEVPCSSSSSSSSSSSFCEL